MFIILYSFFQESGPIHVVSNAQSILDELESHQMALHSMQDGGNGIVGSFIDDISHWQTTLQNIENVVRLLLEVQNRWLELEEVGVYQLYICIIELNTEMH